MMTADCGGDVGVGQPSASVGRAPWLALALILPAPSFGAWMWFWVSPGTTLGFVSYIVGKVWLYGLPLAWYVWVERGRIAIPRPGGRGLFVGAALGLIISGVIWVTYALLPSSMIDPASVRSIVEKNGLANPARYIAAGVYICVVNALLEEYAFRWFIARQCEKLMPVGAAIVSAAVFFVLHHVLVLRAYFDWPITLLGSLGVFIGGVVWSWCFLHFRTLWPAYISHAIVDVAVLGVGALIIFGQD